MGEYDLLGRSRYSGESQTFMGGGNQSNLLLCGRVQPALPSGLDQQHQEHPARGVNTWKRVFICGFSPVYGGYSVCSCH